MKFIAYVDAIYMTTVAYTKIEHMICPKTSLNEFTRIEVIQHMSSSKLNKIRNK